MGHAVLGPSNSSRWLACPASVRMCRNVPSESSDYGREGTQFHTLCEVEVSHRILGDSDLEHDLKILDWHLETQDEWKEEQLRYVEDWVKQVQEFLDEEPGATMHLEVVVDTGIPGCWGTADLVIVYSNRIRVVDIKYGMGVRVSAVGNSQARLYGLGALNTLVEDPLEIHEITNTIWQPRLNNFSEEVLTRTELLEWRDEVAPVAKLALTEDAPFGPSEDACRFCPVSGECGPRTRHLLDRDFGDPDLLNGEEMAEAYSRTSELKRWIADIEDAALKRAYEEAGSVPGFKVVRSGGRRQIVDNDKAVEVLLNANLPPEEVYTRKIATLGKLDKLLGSAEELQEVLGDLLVKSEGRLSLAPDSDPRQPADAVHTAIDDFAGIDEGEA